MNIAVKNLGTLFKSVTPRAVGVLHERRRFSFQTRDYGGITEEAWKSAVLDTRWLTKRYASQITNSRFIHFTPSMDGSLGLPFENGTNRFSYENPRPHATSTNNRQLRLKHLKGLMLAKALPAIGQPQASMAGRQLISNMSKMYFSDSVVNGEVLKQNKGKHSSRSGADEEALSFSTNFVIFAFLFLILVLARDA